MDSDDTEDHADALLDRASIEADIAAGARAYSQLMSSAADDWTRWATTIVGFRALHSVAFDRAGTSDIKSYAYRQAMSSLLQSRKYSVYDQIDKPTRSMMYKLMDRIDEINIWHAGLPLGDQLRWKHPQSIMKHAPRHLVAGGAGGNLPKPGKKKAMFSPEVERLKALLIQVIRRLIKYEPDAAELLEHLTPSDPDDSLDGIGAGHDAEEKR